MLLGLILPASVTFVKGKRNVGKYGTNTCANQWMDVGTSVARAVAGHPCVSDDTAALSSAIAEGYPSLLQPQRRGRGDVSHFSALTVALAATIGTGNIVGVATAVSLGSRRRVVMWLTGVFGIATKYAEAVLSVKYRVVNERGQMAGGPCM